MAPQPGRTAEAAAAGGTPTEEAEEEEKKKAQQSRSLPRIRRHRYTERGLEGGRTARSSKQKGNGATQGEAQEMREETEKQTGTQAREI